MFNSKITIEKNVEGILNAIPVDIKVGLITQLIESNKVSTRYSLGTLSTLTKNYIFNLELTHKDRISKLFVVSGRFEGGVNHIQLIEADNSSLAQIEFENYMAKTDEYEDWVYHNNAQSTPKESQSLPEIHIDCFVDFEYLTHNIWRG